MADTQLVVTEERALTAAQFQRRCQLVGYQSCVAKLPHGHTTRHRQV